MEIENLEEYKKEVFNRTLDLVRRACCQYSCRYIQVCDSSKDHNRITVGCYYLRLLEFFIEAIDGMNLDSITTDKLKDYFVYQHLFLKS